MAKYTIFIDESMSINGIQDYPDFSISLFIIKEDNFKTTKNKFKRAVWSYWEKHGIQKVEIKAHYLKEHNDLDIFLDLEDFAPFYGEFSNFAPFYGEF